MSENPFAPLSPAGKPRLKIVGDEEWAILAPVPADAPPAPQSHPKIGRPSGRWTYRDGAGALLGYALRFDMPQGKEFRPLALWRPANGGAPEWRWATWPAPRPLYGLDALAARPGALVLLCEGEKAADAAARLAPDCVCVTSPNGAKSAGKADWSALRGRRVVIWPDADAAGAAYAQEAARLIQEAGAASVALATLPSGLAEGFDAADAEKDGWTAAQAEALIRAARPLAASEAAPARRGRKAAADAEAPRKKRGVEAVLELIENAGCAFWHGPDKTAYVTFEASGHRENHRVESREFARWVALAAYGAGLTPPAKGTLDDALRLCSARAVAEGPQRRPWLRVGEANGRWYLDLGGEDWSAVEIAPDGWRIVQNHDQPMIRSAAMLALPTPERTGGKGLEALRGFVNTSDAGFMMVVAWLLAAMRARGPYPVAILNGEQGSAKSTVSRLLRNLVDANIAPTRSPPKDETDLVVAARNGHVLALDNVSAISGELSDALCRVATGSGFSARVKYSDADEFAIYVRNPVLLNGIPSLAHRADLASRALVIRLNVIEDDARRSEEELEISWSEAAPRILGGLLDVLAAALARLPGTKPSRASRMADFERLIEAASPALGWAEGAFAQVYRENRDELDASAIEADPVASAILAFVRDEYPRGWAGTASRLLELLNPLVTETIKRSSAWPQTPSALSARLERAKPLLRPHGVTIDRKHSGVRTINVAVAERAG